MTIKSNACPTYNELIGVMGCVSWGGAYTFSNTSKTLSKFTASVVANIYTKNKGDSHLRASFSFILYLKLICSF